MKKRLKFIRKAFGAIKQEMLISLGIIFVLTIVLSMVFYWVERMAQPNVFIRYSDAFVWAYTRYIGDGGVIFAGGPVTACGKVITFLLGIIGIAIVAIPAGLIGSGFMKAIEDEKREKELADLHHKLILAFRPKLARRINDFAGGEKRYTLEPLMQPLITLQTEYLMDTKDVIDVCKRHPEYCLANLASIQTEAENPQDRLAVLHRLHNRPYGYYNNNSSKITIVCTSAWSELATEWFGRTIAELGGFNFICKSIEENPLDAHSYFNMSDRESTNQSTFYTDLQNLSKGEGHWNIYLLHIVTNSTKGGNHIHFNSAMKDGENPTIYDHLNYNRIKSAMVDILNDYGFDCKVEDSERFPLSPKNVAYRLQKDGTNPNSFSVRLGAHIMAKHPFKELIAYRFAEQLKALL